jgi:hypothetical protein
MQQPVAASQEEGVPPAAATAARSAQSQAVAAEDQLPPTAAPDDDAPPAQAAPLPLGGDEFPDQVLAVVCSHLGPRELGRLACMSRRFTEPTFTEPGSGGGGGGGAQLLSPIEEGARLRLAAGSGGGGVAAERWAGETWVRALWRVQCPLKFTSCGREVALSEEGALCLRAERERASGCDARCLGGACA